MRTTLTIDPDVARMIDEAVHRERRPMKQVVNDALRRGLAPSSPPAAKPYHLVPHESALLPGIDPSRLNQLADELDTEDSVGMAAARPRRAS